jgi:hypothetical protein
MLASTPSETTDASRTAAAVAIFVAVLICSYIGLREARMFGPGSRAVPAAGTAILAAIYLTRHLFAPAGPTANDLPVHEADRDLNGYLLPYGALGLTLILMPLLLLLLLCGRWLQNLRSRFRGMLKWGTATTAETPEERDRSALPDDHAGKLRLGKPCRSDNRGERTNSRTVGLTEEIRP